MKCMSKKIQTELWRCLALMEIKKLNVWQVNSQAVLLSERLSSFNLEMSLLFIIASCQVKLQAL